jgi:hypothetical protein
MGEWFLEFQVACAKSEEVMQKKSNKPIRDLGTSQYAFRAPTGNLLDDQHFDTIRFCDPLPSAGRQATEVLLIGQPPHAPQALPASLLQDVPLSALISRTVRVMSVVTVMPASLWRVVCELARIQRSTLPT